MNRVQKITSLFVALIMVMGMTLMPIGVSAAETTAAYIGDVSKDWHDSLAAELGVTFTDYSASTMEEAQIHASAFNQGTLYNYIVIDASLVKDSASYEYLENILLSMLKVNNASIPAVCVVAENSENLAPLKSVCENFGVDLIGLQNKGEEEEGKYIAANFNKAAMKAPVPANKQSAYSHAIYPVNQLSESITITDTTKTFPVYGSYVIVKTDASGSGTFSANVGGATGTGFIKENLASGATYSAYRLGQGQHELQITATGTVTVTAIYSDAAPIYESLVMLGFEDNDLSTSTTNKSGNAAWVDLEVVSDSEKGNVLNVKGKRSDRNGALVIPVMLRHGQKYRVSGQFKAVSMTNYDTDAMNIYFYQKGYADPAASEKVLSGAHATGKREMITPTVGAWQNFSTEFTPTHQGKISGATVDVSDYAEICFMLGGGLNDCEYRIDNIVIEPVVDEDTALKIGYPGSKYENGLIQNFNDGTKVTEWGNRAATNVVQADGTLKITTTGGGGGNVPELARINPVYITPGRYYKVSYSVWTTDDAEYTFGFNPYHNASRQQLSDGTTALKAGVVRTSTVSSDKVTKAKTTYEHIFNLGRTGASDDAGYTTFILSLANGDGTAITNDAASWNGKIIYMDDFKIEPLDIVYNGDFEKGAAYYGADSALTASIVEEDGNSVLMVDTPAANSYIKFYPDLFQGRAYRISMDVKGDAEAVNADGKITATFETTSAMGNYSPSPISNKAVTTEWKTITADFAYHNNTYPYQTFPILKISPTTTGSAGNIYIDNVKIEEISLKENYVQGRDLYGGSFRERVVMGSDDAYFKNGFLYKIYSKDESGNETIYNFDEGKVHRVMFNLNAPDERIDILMDSAIVWGSAKTTLGYGAISEWETVKLGTVKRSNASVTAEFTAKDLSENAILSGKADVDNNDAAKNVVVIMAVYDAYDTLIEAKMSDVTQIGKQGKVSVTINSEKLKDTANSAKLFVLDYNTLCPYVDLEEGVTHITKPTE